MPSLSKDVKAQVEATRLPPILSLIEQSQLIKQGAEAKVYKSTLFPSPLCTPSSSSSPPPPALPVLLKHRFPKTYRHSTLDALLTRQRVTGESRALVRCLKAGVKVPGLRCVDVKQGVLGMEWIEGWSVREVLGGGQEGDELPDEDGEEEEEEPDDVQEMLKGLGVDHDSLLQAVGAEIAKMHLAEVIHGDLTTSNMMVRLLPTRASPNDPLFEVVLIDFGLSSVSFLPEDRAVDLYVLERAFASTHPVSLLPSGEEGVPHFEQVLLGYKRAVEEKGKKGECSRIEKRLEEVRMRGRKRSMVG
ncbi:hypothetical protein BCR35DRAFT_299817 [Leucosporidium creatinivorum]|uniref:non-specific serine/threonine protein kinase n=1 Tax=Leucosporidium creatinivorum TaxID=106004 RepID=A0A1Y2G218_9BASI|nr:hypothetical protein BCR35DRAFT_299817 [Leucosporidium creatinivorum]